MASFITASETVTAVAKINGSIARCGGQGDPKIIGRLLDEAAGINAGRVVAPAGTANLECQEPTTAALVKSAYGFSLYNPSHEAFDVADQTPFYGDNTMVSILTNGSINVDCEGTVVAGEPVYVRHTSDGGSNTELGKVRGDSNGGVTFTTSATANGEYRIRLTNGVVTESFSFTASSSSAADIVTALVAAITASANFVATGTTTGTVTAQTGHEVAIVSLTSPTTATEALWVTTDTQLAAKLPGAYFTESRTGAGVVEVHFERSGAI